MSTESSNPNEATKKCPFCAQTIKAEAIKCHFCGRYFDEKSKVLTNRQYYSFLLIQSSMGYDNPNARNNSIPHPEQLDISVPRYSPKHFTMPYTMTLVCGVWSLLVINWGSSILEMLKGESSNPFGGVSPSIVLTILILSFVFSIVSIVNFFLLLYRCWNVIQDGHARMTPESVFILFVPVINVYWLFIALYGLSEDINKYIFRNKLPVQPCVECIVLLSCICCLLVPEISFLLWAFALYTLMRTARDIQKIKMEQLKKFEN